jgi:ubiquinone/menaquinone biosynthesis C-methylase UbiE
VKKFISRIRYSSRRKKFEQLLNLLQPTPSDKILEVGIANIEYSSDDNFLVKHYSYTKNITALGIGDLSKFKKSYRDVVAIRYDGKVFPFKDSSFDIAHSNAVIEHVGPFEAQEFFLKEIVRVSKKGMITTPNKHFPIEIHTRIPFLHWLGKEKFDYCLKALGKNWATGQYMYLLSLKDLERLAKKVNMKNYRIIRNRYLFCTFTFSLIWFKGV